jgi:uncharacterized membrane protein YeiH
MALETGAMLSLGDWQVTGDITTIDLIAASTNALGGALLARRPDHYRKYTVVGILLMAVAGGIGGGILRDVLLAEVPSALTNPAYIVLCLLAGMIGYRVAHAEGGLFREGFLQLVTAFGLPWYAIVGAMAGVAAGIPVLGSLLLAVVSATAGRYIIDVTSGVTPKQFIRSEWLVMTAVLSGLVWIVLDGIGVPTWPSVIAALLVGFLVRLLALHRGWEEPLAAGPTGVSIHAAGQPLLGRPLHDKSAAELSDVGLVVENGTGAPIASAQRA